MIKRKMLLLSLVLLLWLVPLSAWPIQASANSYIEFYGFVTLKGASLTDTLPVSAWIGEQKIGETMCIIHGAQSLYLLKITRTDLDAYAGQTVTFRVGDMVAEQSAALPEAKSQRVSLNAVEAESRPIQVRFEGVVESIVDLSESAIWVVDGSSIIVNAQTVLTPAGYVVAEGDWVAVKAVGTEEQLVAETIDVRIGAIEAPPFEFVGVIESINEQALMVAGTQVLMDGETEVVGDLLVGHVAQVIGALQTDKAVLARMINTESPQAALTAVQFEDEIVEMNEQYWLFGDASRPENLVKVWVGNAEIPVQGHVGLTAEVTGSRLTDGSVSATRVQVQELNPFDEVRFSGVVTQLGSEAWVVDGQAGAQTVYLDGNSFIDESRAPAIMGNLAQVMAVQRQDGTLMAIRIVMARPE